MNEKIYHTIAENIRSARLQKNLTQEDLAEITGVSANYIYQIEAGRVRIGLSALLKIKEALGIPANELFGEENIDVFEQSGLKEVFLIIKNAPKKEQIIISETVISLNRSLRNVQNI